MSARKDIFTTIHTEGALLPPDLLQRISDGSNIDGLTPESYHRSEAKLNEIINFSWNILQGAWKNFRTTQERLPDTDLGTTITRERWLLPLFRELDYGRLQTVTAVEIEGRSYPISHGWEHVPIHLMSYKLDLDKRATGVAGASSASPHSLLQIFLNRSDDHLWGFVSNGYKLRILRDNASLTRQAYVEFDLEAMMEGEVYSDFVLLWLLCHQSRVEGERPSDCWLENWRKVAVEQGTRALDQLRNGVEEAITALGLGFIEYPSNSDLRDKLSGGYLDKQDYYRQLLRLVYRLLFLFVAEDRDLLLHPDADDATRECYTNYYSTGRLRRMAEKFKGTRHPDCYEGLRLVMRLLSGESNGAGAHLGLVPLGSFLFSDRAVADVIDCQISNQHLLDAIRALSLTYDDHAKVYRSVDYRHLGSEELGSVYESLLELHPQINIPGRRFALSTAGGNERKTTGSYYTPHSLVNALLESALLPVLEEATQQGEAAILNLKICDPACGSGHFLIAAANRMAKALAFVRTGEEEPPPSAIQSAKRDIIGHCIYGVDINPMAVELCKVNLWMEALEPGKPLSFLDHRILCGNSLLGTTPALMANGIPNDAFKPIEGDDKSVASSIRSKNKKERTQRDANVLQLGMSFDLVGANYQALHEATVWIDRAPDDTLAQVRVKEQMHAQLGNDPEYIKARLLADAWCAAFVWEKTPDNPLMPMSDLMYRRLEDNPLADDMGEMRRYVVELADRYQFFHWHVAFPDVFDVPADLNSADNEQTAWNGGFDCVLGNPPWERIKIQEKEWFAERSPDIANAPNAAARRKKIKQLAENDPYLLEAFLDDKRKAEGESHFVRVSDRFPLCGRGDVNTYTIFAETSIHIISRLGRVGIIVPSGIATDDTTKYFFQYLMQNQILDSLYSFENEEFLFIGVHHAFRFCLLTLTGLDRNVQSADFLFYARQVSYLDDKDRHFSLSFDDLKLINPESLTCPILRSGRDLELLRKMYLSGKPISADSVGGYYIRLIHLGDHADAIRLADQLNIGQFDRLLQFQSDNGEMYLRLYESKYIYPFEHRYSTFEDVDKEDVYKGRSRETNIEELQQPSFVVMPRYWVSRQFFHEIIAKYPQQNGWLIAYRDITAATNERTCIATAIPLTPGTVSMPCLGIQDVESRLMILANLVSYCFDFTTRQKVPTTHLTFGMLKQLPVIPPHTYTPTLLDFIVPRVLELSYTAWDLQAFAQDVGYDGPPFIWNEERRFLMRCELDALYFHLYQINRDDVDYIMETFPIVKRKDIARTSDENGEGGEYLTKRIILDIYDEMAQLPKMAVPAPKDENDTYDVPDVGQWETWLSPPPASPDVAHEDKE